ncbi:hypothetical protein QAD02_016187 [Eretmocerus hayati]|uniref:Uncharacterized protein n=1 Tax=Eretmocerus hayati TaxID=131215 RepID=A0ACC2PF65_9HYME|nr:hypothetical protein QAD02_016187 [Eretmocerus hayati]
MLKWTVSRSLSTASSTPHGPGGGGKSNNRRPFRDLSNTPPTARDSMTRRSSSRIISRVSILSDDSGSNGGSGSTARRALCAVKRTPSRRRRCRSHGGDLRGYFHSTKPNNRGDKRSRTSDSPVIIESYYQSTPRQIDAMVMEEFIRRDTRLGGSLEEVIVTKDQIIRLRHTCRNLQG